MTINRTINSSQAQEIKYINTNIDKKEINNRQGSKVRVILEL